MTGKIRALHSFIFFIGIFVTSCNSFEKDRIKPYKDNPCYWQYKDEPVLLLGVSKDDNLFQQKNLYNHLKAIHEIGGNYIRNTMSARIGPEKNEVQAFLKEGELYNLNKWNPEYWERFDNCLRWCQELNIIIQIEIWATHDFFKQQNWNVNPWNPSCNHNYSYNNTTLQRKTASHANVFHPFFNTVPEAQNDSVVLHFQKRYVDQLLSYSLNYPNVLYCITNEIQHAQSPEWSWYWADYIRKKSKKENKNAEITEMFWAPDLKDCQHKHSLDFPELFTYIEVSQNSAISGRKNSENLEYIRKYISSNPRPMNSVKIYGKSGKVKWPGTDDDAIERFWGNILGGCASSRFHRDELGKYGLGFTEPSINSVKSMRLFTEQIIPWKSKPANHLIVSSDSLNYKAMGNRGNWLGLYFHGKDEIFIDVHEFGKKLQVKWINILEAISQDSSLINTSDTMKLSPPHKGHWAVILKPL